MLGNHCRPYWQVKQLVVIERQDTQTRNVTDLVSRSRYGFVNCLNGWVHDVTCESDSVGSIAIHYFNDFFLADIVRGLAIQVTVSDAFYDFINTAIGIRVSRSNYLASFGTVVEKDLQRSTCFRSQCNTFVGHHGSNVLTCGDSLNS